ncbi:MAG: 50S ribosomal protein L28 [SAR324 cluster bacterium]|nr:50S ribosomal protein L28 [SAR324 cluster bacterium]MDP7405338.1 50S ribosomal protein L28 [SAR324 cluster bacterium]
MSLKCQICGKIPGNGFRVSHAHNRNKRRWLPNIQNVRVLQPGGNRKKIRVCTSCIRSGKTLAAS